MNTIRNVKIFESQYNIQVT